MYKNYEAEQVCSVKISKKKGGPAVPEEKEIRDLPKTTLLALRRSVQKEAGTDQAYTRQGIQCRSENCRPAKFMTLSSTK